MKNTIKDEEKEENKITEEIELKTQLMSVKGELRKNITQDYTLATLTSVERDFITENYENAEFAKELIRRFGDKGYAYEFNDNEGDWIRNSEGKPQRIEISDTDKRKIHGFAQRIFTFFMIKPHLISVLGRNVSNNFMVKLLGKYQEEEEPVVYNADDRSLLKKAMDAIRGKGDDYEQE